MITSVSTSVFELESAFLAASKLSMKSEARSILYLISSTTKTCPSSIKTNKGSLARASSTLESSSSESETFFERLLKEEALTLEAKREKESKERRADATLSGFIFKFYGSQGWGDSTLNWRQAAHVDHNCKLFDSLLKVPSFFTSFKTSCRQLQYWLQLAHSYDDDA